MNQYEKCEAEASEQADWADSLAIPGEVYFADTKRVLPDLKKVGGTSKTGPERVRKLSTAGVPEPYVCYRSIAVKDWRLVEKSIHEYFKEARVYPGKEFFLLSDKDVDTICDAIEGKVQMSDKEHANWTFSVRTARERLEKSRRKRFGTMQEDDAGGLGTAMGGDNGSTSAAGAREVLEQPNTLFFSTKPSTPTSIAEPREAVVCLQCDTCSGVANECENSQKTEQEEPEQQMENSMLDSQSDVEKALMHQLQASELERNKVGDDKFSIFL